MQLLTCRASIATGAAWRKRATNAKANTRVCATQRVLCTGGPPPCQLAGGGTRYGVCRVEGGVRVCITTKRGRSAGGALLSSQINRSIWPAALATPGPRPKPKLMVPGFSGQGPHRILRARHAACNAEARRHTCWGQPKGPAMNANERTCCPQPQPLLG